MEVGGAATVGTARTAVGERVGVAAGEVSVATGKVAVAAGTVAVGGAGAEVAAVVGVGVN